MLALAFFAVAALLVCIAFALTGWDAARSLAWAETSCRIEWIRVSAHQRPHGRSDSYTVDAQYSYVTPEGVLTANRLRFAFAAYGERADAEAELDRYPRGASLPCYYDPRNPADAVIDRGWDYGGAWMWAAVLGFIALGLAVRRLGGADRQDLPG